MNNQQQTDHENKRLWHSETVGSSDRMPTLEGSSDRMPTLETGSGTNGGRQAKLVTKFCNQLRSWSLSVSNQRLQLNLWQQFELSPPM